MTSSKLNRHEIHVIPPPCILRQPCAHSYTSPVVPGFVVGCCLKFISRRPAKASTYFILFNFLSISLRAKAMPLCFLTRSTPSNLSPSPPPDCYVVWPNSGHLWPRNRPFLHLFLSINLMTKVAKWRHPTRSAQVASIPQCPPHL